MAVALAGIAAAATIVEVNTRGLYKKRSDELFPGNLALKKIFEAGIPVTLNSDAHRPEELDGYFDYGRRVLKDIGFEKMMLFTEDGWVAVPI